MDWFHLKLEAPSFRNILFVFEYWWQELVKIVDISGECSSASFLIKLKLQQLLSSSFCLVLLIIFPFMNSH